MTDNKPYRSWAKTASACPNRIEITLLIGYPFKTGTFKKSTLYFFWPSKKEIMKSIYLTLKAAYEAGQLVPYHRLEDYAVEHLNISFKGQKNTMRMIIEVLIGS